MICINSNSNNLIDFDVVKPDLFPWSMEDGAFMSTKNMNEEDNSSSSTAYYCRESHNAGKRAAPCQYLPPQFQPNNFTVMIGRCKEARSNIGNRRLRVLASTYLRQYAKADSKRVKSNIVKEIRDAILEAEGQFIQMDEDKRWYIVNDTVAREKIGYVLRDLLADQYKSSSKQKSAVAKERRHREHLQQDSFTAPMVPTCSTNLSMKNSNYYMVPPSVETTNGGGVWRSKKDKGHQREEQKTHILLLRRQVFHHLDMIFRGRRHRREPGKTCLYNFGLKNKNQLRLYS
eukprot:Nitzschia sp. Nitz4//scaffold2_size372955//228695//229616//NITZ4_000440-RA/size372955-processed-gene-0.520-mRNA-1//-1//CDS//3329546829//1838//frame0